MRTAIILISGIQTGRLEEIEFNRKYRFVYNEDYSGPPVSLSMPLSSREYVYDRFPPFFDGLLPEGAMLEGLLRQRKVDAKDYFSQLIAVGGEMVGTVTVLEEKG